MTRPQAERGLGAESRVPLRAFAEIPAFLLMGYTQITLYVPMAMMGIAFALVPAVIWPSVAYIVEPRTVGTALGLMTMIPVRRSIPLALPQMWEVKPVRANCLLVEHTSSRIDCSLIDKSDNHPKKRFKIG